MSKFEMQINWLTEQKTQAQERVLEFLSGRRDFLNDNELTNELLDRARSDIARFQNLISAYKKMEAK
jgi:hypothetical protein